MRAWCAACAFACARVAFAQPSAEASHPPASRTAANHESDATAAERAPASTPDTKSGESARSPERVLFLLPPTLPAEDREALGEALMAQFSLGKAELLLALDAEGDGRALGDRIATAQRRANEVRAAAVFWIDPEPGGRWLVHVFDPAGNRLLVRPVDAGSGHTSAAIETVAVMARDSTDALLSGDLPAAAPVPAPPPPPAPARPPVEPPTPTRHVRLSLSYLGQDFADRVPWRHGASVGGAWVTTTGLFAGAAYTLSEGARVTTPVLFEVDRPLLLLLFGGYRHRIGGLSLDAALGVTIGLLERHTPGQAGAAPASDSTRMEAAFSPRFRLEWAISPPLGIHLGGGLDVLFNNFSYIQRGVTDTELLRPLPARGVLEAGIAYYP